ncbi:hypothetical protein Pelo_3610 [Pelomyxa schiedti]|nr:hypothetical protein Pelo_3610 [Pelomyxa schiedti]
MHHQTAATTHFAPKCTALKCHHQTAATTHFAPKCGLACSKCTLMHTALSREFLPICSVNVKAFSTILSVQ